ncbi:MAG: penicillin-binding protein 2, partial [Actinomycetes bacterium]
MGNLNLAKKRLVVLTIFALSFMVLFAFRLVQVQIIQAGDYKIRAMDEMQDTRSIPAKRGDITDINGVTFARSVSAINIVVDQTQISDPARVAAFAAPILKLPVKEVQTAITGKLKYSMVLPNAQPAIWRALIDAMATHNAALQPREIDQRIIGFFAERGYIRDYPSGPLLASLIGFVRNDGIGATGLESSMNSTITGTAGRYSYARAAGAEIPGSQSEIVSAKKGTSIRLTIDRDVQWVASKAISDAVRKSGALSGT